MFKILCFGSLNLDYVYQVEHLVAPAETLSAVSRAVFPGGKGLNQAVAAARAGACVYQAGAVGADGALLLETLASAGVRTEYVRQHELPTGHAIIEVDRHGENAILLYGGANQSLERSEIDETLQHFAKGDLLLVQNETNELEYLIRSAVQHGLKVALNVSPFAPELIKLPLELCSYLLVNEVEGAALSGLRQDEDGEKLITALAERYPHSLVILTLGARGSWCKAQGQSAVFCRSCKVKAVDTTAAGDTYTGYILTALMEGQGLEEAMQLASCAAALAVTRQGAAPSIPHRAEVTARLRERP
ncbi:MAG: ribokinase [Succinivibrio sp.]|nr:ribokinase [Succinivibrio sp.]